MGCSLRESALCDNTISFLQVFFVLNTTSLILIKLVLLFFYMFIGYRFKEFLNYEYVI